MKLYEAIKDMESYKKKVIEEYRIECANADFDNVKRPSRKSFYAEKLRSYYIKNIQNEIDKAELSNATHYFTNNIPLNQTNDYKYLNDNEIGMLENICAIDLTGIVLI